MSLFSNYPQYLCLSRLRNYKPGERQKGEQSRDTPGEVQGCVKWAPQNGEQWKTLRLSSLPRKPLLQMCICVQKPTASGSRLPVCGNAAARDTAIRAQPHRRCPGPVPCLPPTANMGRAGAALPCWAGRVRRVLTSHFWVKWTMRSGDKCCGFVNLILEFHPSIVHSLSYISSEPLNGPSLTGLLRGIKEIVHK